MSLGEITQQAAIIERVYQPYIQETRSNMTTQELLITDYRAREAQQLLVETPGNFLQDMALFAFANADPHFVEEVIAKRKDANRKEYDRNLQHENKKAALNYECPPVAVDINFATALRNARTKKNLTQEALSRLINVRLVDFRSWEIVGGKRPTGVQRARLNRALDTVLPK